MLHADQPDSAYASKLLTSYALSDYLSRFPNTFKWVHVHGEGEKKPPKDQGTYGSSSLATSKRSPHYTHPDPDCPGLMSRWVSTSSVPVHCRCHATRTQPLDTLTTKASLGVQYTLHT